MTADTPPTATTTAAFAALDRALKAEAMEGDYERLMGFIRRVGDLAQRHAAGAPAHTPKRKGGGE